MPLLTPCSAISGFAVRLSIGIAFVLAVHRYFLGLKCALSTGIFSLLFYLRLAGDLFPLMNILACNVSCENAVRKGFLGLAAFVVKKIPRGLCMRFRFFKAAILGARFVAFVFILFHHVALVTRKFSHFFIDSIFLLFMKVCYQNFTQNFYWCFRLLIY